MPLKVGDLAKFKVNAYGSLLLGSITFRRGSNIEGSFVHVPVERVYQNVVEILPDEFDLDANKVGGGWVYLISEDCCKYVSFGLRLEPL